MEGSLIPCKFYKLGCEKTQLEASILAHEEICDFRLCCCIFPIEKCKWQGRLFRIIDHLTTYHRLGVLQGDAVVFTADDYKSDGDKRWEMLQSCFDAHFMLVLIRRPTGESAARYFASVQLLGTKRKAESFKFRMELAKDDKQMEWEGKPRCVFDNMDLNDISISDCLIFDNDIALLYADDQALNITVTIKMSEDEGQMIKDIKALLSVNGPLQTAFDCFFLEIIYRTRTQTCTPSPVSNMAMNAAVVLPRSTCKYSDHGCPETLCEMEKSAHEESCNYRLYDCPFTLFCQWKGKLSQVLDHLVQFHSVAILPGNSAILEVKAGINSSENLHWALIQSCFGKHFMVFLGRRQVQRDFKKFCAAVQLLSTQKEAEKFIYKLELGSGHRRMAWEGKPLSLDHTLQPAFDSNDCLIFDFYQASVFVKNYILKVTTTISEFTDASE